MVEKFPCAVLCLSWKLFASGSLWAAFPVGYLRGRRELEVFYRWCCTCWERVQSEILLCYLSVYVVIKICCDLGSEKIIKT